MTDAAPQWVPTNDDIAEARVTDFARFVQARTGVPTVPDYRALWQWSADDPGAFWAALWDYFDLGDRPEIVLDDEQMPGAVVSRHSSQLRRPGRATPAPTGPRSSTSPRGAKPPRSRGPN